MASRFLITLEIPINVGGDDDPDGGRPAVWTTRDIPIEVNLPSFGKWRGDARFLPGCTKAAWNDGDQDPAAKAPQGGCSFFNDAGTLIFKMTSFKPRGLESYKPGHQGDGFFVNSTLALSSTDFTYTIISVDGRTADDNQ